MNLGQTNRQYEAYSQKSETKGVRKSECEVRAATRPSRPLLASGWPTSAPTEQFALLWVLNLSDGEHSLLDIAERSGLSFESVRKAADALLTHNLLRQVIE